MDFIGIALIIAVVSGVVHYVHVDSYKRGARAGVIAGRQEILEENLLRIEVQGRHLDEEANAVEAVYQDVKRDA